MSPKRKKIYRHQGLSKAKLLTFGALLFSFGIVTSVTTTFAWYTIRSLSSIDNLNISIDMPNATLKLSLLKDDGTLIHKEDGYTKNDLGIDDIELSDVSGMFQSDWLNDNTNMDEDVPMFCGSYRHRTSYTKTDYAQRNVDYVQNTFYFEAGMDCTIYLDPSSHIEANVEENKKVVATHEGKELDKLNEVVHAVRVSFFTNEGYIIANPGESNVTEYGGILDLDLNGYYDYNADSGEEILYGEYTGSPSYTRLNSDNEDPYVGGNTFTAHHKQGTKTYDPDSVEIKKEESYKIDSLRYEVDNPLKGAIPICTVKEGEPKRIVISIYVEGWDKHMTDDISAACFDVSISFLALFDK